MRARNAHHTHPPKKPKGKSNSKKRSLNALSIASHQIPEKIKSKYRTGAQGDGKSKNKRNRDEYPVEDESEFDLDAKRRKKWPTSGDPGEANSDGGSDSEGNQWKIGQVDPEDDTELDSDEAFGESDGDESEDEDEVKDRDEDDDDDEEEDEDEDEDDDDDDDDDEVHDPAKISALQDLISNLTQLDKKHNDSSSTHYRNKGASEYNVPSDFGLTSKTKITLEDLGLPKINDPDVKKSLKVLKSNDGKATQKLAVPLAKRQQDRLDRSAAYEKSKEVLDRWTDTVKHNRRADHLAFPLADNGMASAKLNRELVPTNISKPHNDLETTIQNILEESGLMTVDGKDDEDHIREFEELETKKMSIEEIKLRRDQLRMARELLFREEAKSKRIKKIKSKSYRRVHRKQREKIALSEQQALAEQGIVPSDDELEARDRKRAEERMGAKHKNNKWAKAMKETGRAIWDEETKTGIMEMAQKDEELRKRIEGKIIRNEFEESESSDSNGNDSSEDDEPSYKQKLLQELRKLEKPDFTDQLHPGTKLAKMDFMRRADAARKKENDAMIEEMRRDLAGEESPGAIEEKADDIGRRIFGLCNAPNPKEQKYTNTDELGESSESDDEKRQEPRLEPKTKDNTAPGKVPKKNTKPSSMKAIIDSNVEGDAWSKVRSKSMEIGNKEVNRRKQKHDAIDVEDLDLSKAAVVSKNIQIHKSTSKSNTSSIDSNDDDSGNPFLINSDHELVKRAFAGADVVDEFETEKKQTIRDEDDKTIDNTLPGWGSWIGDGVSKRELKRNKGRFLATSKGIKAQNRKDFKLKGVIINEKRVKKNGKYLASSLPHPFENRQQYEGSLRIPIGPEWTTKHTFQDATMPRILLKQGIIAPMSNPLL
ncbi:hypothetical protein K3495_g9537 [Podosphaera aphanis]|nr:hypothetical protein K3495_g9537 [Podosphaera aphanis]